MPGLYYLFSMLDEYQTVADLRKAGTITSREIVAAVDTFMRNPHAGPYHFASGYSLDIAVAAVALAPAPEAKAGQGRQDKTYRNAVTVAVMLARPTPPGSA
ncbi:hypothetical protein MKK67_18575 [Methylobacterium sp. J-072]|uniref:hypothetical protein n=1 Tax=Methylobacterium sp. J-072 TaxID=2836651 RepID=UPI001FBA0ABA|nr:hypothetical protein [Methylobacterium sp. J-072]MCJ2094480.1 hypothetical protein [Methylobacterium sp. J-072]